MKYEPVILAIETALPQGSLAIFKGDRELDSFTGTDKSLRSDDLLQTIKCLLDKNSLQIGRIDQIAVSTGPGSFTGIKVGIATAQALALAINCRVIGISLLEVLAYGYMHEDGIISVTSAGRNQLFWQEFKTEKMLNEKNNRDKRKIQTGSLDDFINCLNRKYPESAVVISSGLKETASLLIEKANNKNKFYIASDNTARFHALFSIKKFKQNESTEFEIAPNYIMDVEIGSFT